MPAKWEKFANEKMISFNSSRKTIGKQTCEIIYRVGGAKWQRLRMVGLASEIGVQDLLAVRFVVMFAGRFGGYEDRVDLSENLWIVESHRPSALPSIVLTKNAQAMGRFLDASLSTPDMKDYVGLEPSRGCQIVCVKRQ